MREIKKREKDKNQILFFHVFFSSLETTPLPPVIIMPRRKVDI